MRADGASASHSKTCICSVLLLIVFAVLAFDDIGQVWKGEDEIHQGGAFMRAALGPLHEFQAC